MAKSAALRRYDRAVIVLSLAYAAALIAANMVFKGNAPARLLAYAVAILPALPIIGMFAAIGRYLNEERDEYVPHARRPQDRDRQRLCAQHRHGLGLFGKL